MKTHLHLLALLPGLVLAADLPPDKGNAIPESAQRPVVVTGKPTMEVPKADLPDGYTLSVAAAAPLVLHPIMGCLDDKGRLFIGDGTGVNWNKAQLDANPPNRVLIAGSVVSVCPASSAITPVPVPTILPSYAPSTDAKLA